MNDVANIVVEKECPGHNRSSRESNPSSASSSRHIPSPSLLYKKNDLKNGNVVDFFVPIVLSLKLKRLFAQQ